jgi:hypothetical protein
MSATNQDTAPFFGFIGAASALVFSCEPMHPGAACGWRVAGLWHWARAAAVCARAALWQVARAAGQPLRRPFVFAQAWVRLMALPSRAWALPAWA